MTILYHRVQVPMLNIRDVGAIRYPAPGTVIEDPAPNPQFILEYLIGVVLDIAIVLTEHECATLAYAVATAHFYKLVSPAPTSFAGRNGSVLVVIDRMIEVYNVKAVRVQGAPLLAIFNTGEQDRNARNLVFNHKEIP